MNINRPDCPICFNANSKILGNVRTINPNSASRVELRSCNSCGHWWHSPVPEQDELIRLYEQESPFVVSRGARESYRSKNQIDLFHNYILKHIKINGGNYLEIGAGGGGLLRRFREMNYKCYGVDPAQWVEDDCIVKTLQEIPRGMKFDVIVLQDVLEHVLDPRELLSNLKALASDSCQFFFAFPCNNSIPAFFYQTRWSMVLPYGHLHYFSFKSAFNLFKSSGLQVCEMRLSRTTSLSKILFSLNIRRIIYEFFPGTKDQMFSKCRNSL